MTIKRRMPWPLKIIPVAIVAILGGTIALWAYDAGRSFTGLNPASNREQIDMLKAEVEVLRAERDRLSSTVNAAESQSNIEKSAQKQLVIQVKALEAENIKLKENLAFFESLLPADTGPSGLSIRRIKAEIVAPNQLRYRLLIMQGGKGEHVFVGNLQLVVTVLQEGKSAMISFPDGKLVDMDRFRLSFRHYQRVEGMLTLPEGVSIKSIQARVLERGQVRVQQTAAL
ncbi:MAG TPA: DUF6776 family protein [Burkholderiaceae bacterium]|nr:DUF6776 family protein [Burkholderiaceae bacterium]